MSAIEVRIPYLPDQQLGTAYNKAMEVAEDWVLFLDHDIYLLNPHWYDICSAAIEKVGHEAGLISCYTNRIGCAYQLAGNKHTDNIKDHTGIAQRMYRKNKGQLLDVTSHEKSPSGFFILTHKKAWEEAGGFPLKFLGADTQYWAGVRAAGYKVYLLSDLYVYHGYQRNHMNGNFDAGDTNE